jgi:hypothetical protein
MAKSSKNSKKCIGQQDFEHLAIAVFMAGRADIAKKSEKILAELRVLRGEMRQLTV